MTEAEVAEEQRAAEVEQLITQIEELQANNAELSAIGDHSSERIVALEAELEEVEAEGLSVEESVRVHKEEIELLQAQIAALQGEGELEHYELPAPEEASYEYELDEDDGAGVPAGHDEEDLEEYEVDDTPSWES